MPSFSEAQQYTRQRTAKVKVKATSFKSQLRLAACHIVGRRVHYRPNIPRYHLFNQNNKCVNQERKTTYKAAKLKYFLRTKTRSNTSIQQFQDSPTIQTVKSYKYPGHLFSVNNFPSVKQTLKQKTPKTDKAMMARAKLPEDERVRPSVIKKE